MCEDAVVLDVKRQCSPCFIQPVALNNYIQQAGDRRNTRHVCLCTYIYTHRIYVDI